MFASSFHHWTSTSDSPRNANSMSWLLQVGWPGRRSALTRSGITERSPGCRRRTSIPTLLSAGGPYLGPARLGAVEGATAAAASLSGTAIGSTVGAMAWEAGSVPGDWGGGGAAGGSPGPESGVDGGARSGRGGPRRRVASLGTGGRYLGAGSGCGATGAGCTGLLSVNRGRVGSGCGTGSKRETAGSGCAAALNRGGGSGCGDGT